MPLQEGAFRVQFGAGVSTKVDEHVVPPTKLLALENAVFGRPGTLTKRNGYELLSNEVPGFEHLASRDKELLAFTSNRGYSYQDNPGQWNDAGPVFSVTSTSRPVARTGSEQTMPDIASINGATVAAWEDSRGGVWWSIVDDSGRMLHQPEQADALGVSPRCVASGNGVLVFYARPSTRMLFVVVVDPSTPAVTPQPQLLFDDLDSTNPVYDACPSKRPNTPAFLAYCEASSTRIRIAYITPSGVVGGPSTGDPGSIVWPAARDAATPIAVAHRLTGSDVIDRVVVAYSQAGRGVVLTFTVGSASLPFVDTEFGIITDVINPIRAATGIADTSQEDSTVWAVFESPTAEPSEHRCIAGTLSIVEDTVAAFPAILSVGLASGVFLIGDDAFATFVHDTSFFNVYLALRLSDGVPLARMVPGSGAGLPARRHVARPVIGDGTATVAVAERERVLTEIGTSFRETGIRSFTYTFDDRNSHQTAQLGRGLYMAGAICMHYDGAVWSEFGFHVGPELIGATPGAGGAMTASTTYEYRAWYESTDAQGEVHQGPTSAGTLVTMGGGQTKVTLTLPMLRLTRKTTARICVARSLAAKTGKTAQLFRVTSLDLSTDGDINGAIVNDPTVDSVTFVDAMSDATLANQEEIYTDGGILSNDPIAIGSVVVRGKRRLFAPDAIDATVARCSQELGDGLAVEWPPDLTIPTDPFGGDITAIAFDGDRVVLFKANAIFAFNGDGPLGNGDASTSAFTQPELITTDVGCTDPESIVVTPVGLMFRSSKGIYRINPGGAVVKVGADVDGYNAQVIRTATMLPDRTQVVFLTDAGLTLVYDHYADQWSTFTNHEGKDAAVVNGLYHYLRTDGRVYRETPGIYRDGLKRIKMRIETARLHMQEQLQGFQRFWFAHVLGTWRSPHQLGIQYRLDDTNLWGPLEWVDATASATPDGWIRGDGANVVGEDPINGTTYSEGNFGDGPYGGFAADRYAWRIHVSEKGEAIQFALEDFEAAGEYGPSFEVTELLITGGVKGNARRPYSGARST